MRHVRTAFDLHLSVAIGHEQMTMEFDDNRKKRKENEQKWLK